MAQNQEQRLRRRRSLIVEVQVRDREEVYLYSARNLSAGGMFIDTPVPLPSGTDIQVEFRLPQQEPIVASATVRWNTEMVAEQASRVRYPGMGVLFTKLSPSDSRRVRSWIAQES